MLLTGRFPATRLLLALFILAAASGLCGRAARAQSAVTSATLSGRVEDANGAALPGVLLTAANVETGREQTVVSDEAGRYRFAYLPVGSYRLRAEKQGFSTLGRQFTLTVGQALEFPLRLAVGEVAESVEVSGADVPVVGTARTQLAETVVQKEIEGLPLNGRNYLDLAALTPGVTRTNPVANQRFPETSAVPGTGLSFGGQRFINNGFVVTSSSASTDA